MLHAFDLHLHPLNLCSQDAPVVSRLVLWLLCIDVR